MVMESGQNRLPDTLPKYFLEKVKQYGDKKVAVRQKDFGIWQEYYAQPNQPRAYVYTDRPLYRPGQPVYFKGVVRIDDDLSYSLPDVSNVKVTVSSFEETIFEDTLPLSPFGSFEGQIVLDNAAALGSYSIVVKMDSDDTEIGSVNFGVAEYHKPEYLVTVAADHGLLAAHRPA